MPIETETTKQPINKVISAAFDVKNLFSCIYLFIYLFIEIVSSKLICPEDIGFKYIPKSM